MIDNPMRRVLNLCVGGTSSFRGFREKGTQEMEFHPNPSPLPPWNQTRPFSSSGASAESASRRGVIPEVKETVTKKQAVTYPYSYPSTMPSYYMTHGVSPYTAMVRSQPQHTLTTHIQMLNKAFII